MQKSRLNRIGIMPSIMFPSGEISWSRNFSQRTAHISQMRQNLIGKHCGFIDGTVIPLNPALSACGKAIGSAIFVNVHFNGTTHHYNAKRWWLKICLGNSWDLEIVPLGWDQRSNSFLFLRCLFIPFVPHKNCLAARDLRKREGRQREAKELSLPLVANEPLAAYRTGCQSAGQSDSLRVFEWGSMAEVMTMPLPLPCIYLKHRCLDQVNDYGNTSWLGPYIMRLQTSLPLTQNKTCNSWQC